MSNFITRNLKQDATIWVASAKDAYGNPSYATPVSIKVRWESRIEKTLDSKGNEIVSQAYVYMPSEYTPGDYIVKGITVTASPVDVANSYEIRNAQEIPNLRNTFSEFRVIL